MRARLLPLTVMTTAALLLGAAKPDFSGVWMLDQAKSNGQTPEYAAVSIAQNSHWFRSTRLEKDGRTERTVESECQTDGRFHPVSGAEGGSVKCTWKDGALLIEKHWNDARDTRTVRMTLASEGAPVQEVTENAAGKNGSAHLVWTRR